MWDLLVPYLSVLLSGPPVEGEARDALREGHDVSCACALLH